MASGTTDNNAKWVAFIESIAGLKHISVKAGVQSDAGMSKGRKPAKIVEYATYNEFGTATIPARPFISSTADKKRTEWLGYMDDGVNAVMQGKTDLKRVFNKLGLKMTGDIKRTINQLKVPPNKSSTIKAKGSNKPLIDSGSLLGSIRHEVSH